MLIERGTHHWMSTSFFDFLMVEKSVHEVKK